MHNLYFTSMLITLTFQISRGDGGGIPNIERMLGLIPTVYVIILSLETPLIYILLHNITCLMRHMRHCYHWKRGWFFMELRLRSKQLGAHMGWDHLHLVVVARNITTLMVIRSHIVVIMRSQRHPVDHRHMLQSDIRCIIHSHLMVALPMDLYCRFAVLDSLNV